MKHDLILKRSVDVNCWRVKATIARPEKRAEFIPLLMRVDEVQKCTARDIAEHLFGERHARKTICERLLDVAEQLQLVTRGLSKYSLTEMGKEAIKTEEVFIPEEGVWDIYFSYDPLVGILFLNCDAYDEPKARNEIMGKGAKDKLAGRSKDIVKFTGQMKKWSGKKFECCSGGGHVRFDSDLNKGERIKTNRKIFIEWNVTQNKITASEDRTVLNEYSLMHKTEDSVVLSRLIEQKGLAEDWDYLSGTLTKQFDDMSGPARWSLLENISFIRPTVGDYKSFDDVLVKDIPIKPSSDFDARCLAVWRLEKSINQLATKVNYETWQNRAVTGLDEFDIALPSRNEFAEELWTTERNETAWFLKAAADWNL